MLPRGLIQTWGLDDCGHSWEIMMYLSPVVRPEPTRVMPLTPIVILQTHQ